MELAGIRVSDAERRVVVDRLGEHYADGRLTVEELRARTVEAWAARTDADLAVALRELPVLAAEAPQEAPPRWRFRGPGVPAHAALAAAGVTAAWAVEAGGSTPGDQWPLALGVVWGAGLAVHAAGAWLRRQGAFG